MGETADPPEGKRSAQASADHREGTMEARRGETRRGSMRTQDSAAGDVGDARIRGLG